MGKLIFLHDSPNALKEIFTSFNELNEEQIKIEHNSFTNELLFFVHYDSDETDEKEACAFVSLNDEEAKALVLALAKNVNFSSKERESLLIKLAR